MAALLQWGLSGFFLDATDPQFPDSSKIRFEPQLETSI
jgi:hypothetical protein